MWYLILLVLFLGVLNQESSANEAVSWDPPCVKVTLKSGKVIKRENFPLETCKSLYKVVPQYREGKCEEKVFFNGKHLRTMFKGVDACIEDPSFMSAMLPHVSAISWSPVNLDGKLLNSACSISWKSSRNYPEAVKSSEICKKIHESLVKYLIKKGHKRFVNLSGDKVVSCDIEMEKGGVLLKGLHPDNCNMKTSYQLVTWNEDGSAWQFVGPNGKHDPKVLMCAITFMKDGQLKMIQTERGPFKRFKNYVQKDEYYFAPREKCPTYAQIGSLSDFYYSTKGYSITRNTGEFDQSNCIGGASECSVQQNGDHRTVIEKGSQRSPRKQVESPKATRH